MLIPTFVDVESFYGPHYSLSHLTGMQYILDPRFQFICCSILDSATGELIEGRGPDGVAAAFRKLDWSDRWMITHNIKFDGAAIAWHLGIIPAFYGDTMGMAQIYCQPYCGKAGLGPVAHWLGFPEKGDEVVRAFGKRYEHFTPAELDRYVAYCHNDMLRCKDIFYHLGPFLPPQEARTIDHTARMYIQPQLQLQPEVLRTHLVDVQRKKAELLENANLPDRSSLMSDEKFADMLRALDVEPPMKLSPKTNQPVYAFAKTDEEFTDLLEDEDEEVVALVAARLGHKTTIEETRTQRFLDIAALTPERWMPVPLRYGAALTHRAGGTDKINLQNLGRKSPLRRAIVCPPGYKIVAVDASQIELRLLMWQAGQEEMLELFEQKRNAYIEFGVHLLGRRVSKEHDLEDYTLCKISVLSCGYAVSPPKFRRAARAQSDGRLRLSLEQASLAVSTYRSVNYQVPDYWKFNNEMITHMMYGEPRQLVIDGEVVWQTDLQMLKGPGGLNMVYPGLRRIDGGRGFLYDHGRIRDKRLFGAKLTENQCQHLARLIVYDAGLRILDRTGYRYALQAHDELVYVIPEHDVARMEPILVEEMSRRPTWARRLPLAAEVNHGDNYGECK